jgi:hypothetical protein
MAGLCEEVLAIGEFDDLSLAHDCDAAAEVGDNRQIMADQDVGEGELSLELLEEVQDLGLDGDVECACWLIADDDIRAERKGARDGDALALATGELVGVAGAGIGGEAAADEELGGACGAILRGADGVDVEWLFDDVGDAHARIERAARILEDDLHAPSDGDEFGTLRGDHVSAMEMDGSLCDGDEAEDGAAEGGLAAAGLADDAQGFAGCEREGDAIDGAAGDGGCEWGGAAGWELDDEVADDEDAAGGGRGGAGRLRACVGG